MHNLATCAGYDIVVRINKFAFCCGVTGQQ